MLLYKRATVAVSSLAVREGSSIHRDANLDDVVFVSSSEGHMWKERCCLSGDLIHKSMPRLHINACIALERLE